MTYALDFGAREASEGVGTVRCCDETRLAEVVLGLQIPHLGLIGPVHNSNGNGEDGISLVSWVSIVLCFRVCPAYLCLFPDGFVDDIVVLHHFLLHGVGQVL